MKKHVLAIAALLIFISALNANAAGLKRSKFVKNGSAGADGAAGAAGAAGPLSTHVTDYIYLEVPASDVYVGSDTFDPFGAHYVVPDSTLTILAAGAYLIRSSSVAFTEFNIAHSTVVNLDRSTWSFITAGIHVTTGSTRSVTILPSVVTINSGEAIALAITSAPWTTQGGMGPTGFW